MQGIDNAEIIEAVHARRAPMIPVSASPPLWDGIASCRSSRKGEAKRLYQELPGARGSLGINHLADR